MSDNRKLFGLPQPEDNGGEIGVHTDAFFSELLCLCQVILSVALGLEQKLDGSIVLQNCIVPHQYGIDIIVKCITQFLAILLLDGNP